MGVDKAGKAVAWAAVTAKSAQQPPEVPITAGHQRALPLPPGDGEAVVFLSSLLFPTLPQ